jgi:hypothetical protein
MTRTGSASQIRRRALRTRRMMVVGVVTGLLLGIIPVGAIAENETAPPTTVTERIEHFGAASNDDEGWSQSEVVESPIAFTMVGFAAPSGSTLQFRYSADGDWSDWIQVEFLDEDDGPDPGTSEDVRSADPGHGRLHTEPVWVGEATHLQLRIADGSLEQVEASVIDGDGVSRSLLQRVGGLFRAGVQPAAAQAADVPLPVISRRGWGADEAKRNSSPRYADAVRFSVVHHTAHTTVNPNGYTREQAPGIMRAMYAYHTDTLGWSDIGYNIVVDRFGRIYEGRAGGLARPVIGAHAGGFNSGSVGVSIMGNFESELPSPEARAALARVLAWQFGIHNIDPGGSAWVESGGNGRFAAGRWLELPTISGHRDSSWTACPGTTFYARLGDVRAAVAAQLPPAIPRHSFPDVGSNTYYDGSVSWLQHHGITDGWGATGTYAPGRTVTRGQMAAFLWRLAGRPSGYADHGFPDVRPGSYYDEAVRWMFAEGITDGYGTTGRFEPSRAVSRGEMAAFLWRYAGRPEGDPAHRFPDVSDQRYFDVAVRWLRQNGITDGYGSTGEYRPGNSITRAQMAAMLWRLGATPPAWRASPTLSPYVTF